MNIFKKLLRFLGILIVDLLLIAFAVLFSIILIPLCLELIYEVRYGSDTVWMLTGNQTWIPLAVGLLFIVLIFYFFLPRKLMGGLEENWLIELVDRLTMKKKLIVSGISFLVLILGCLFGSLNHDRFESDRVVVSKIGQETEYTWTDVESYTLKTDHDGTLIVELTMTDGNAIGFIGGAFRVVTYTSTGFDQIFPNGDADYAVYVARELKALGILPTLDNWDALMEKLDYDYWKAVAEEIREITQ